MWFEVLVLLSSDARRRVNHYGFESFIIACALDSTHDYSRNRRSAVINWSFVNGVSFWITYGFADGSVNDLTDAVFRSERRDMSGAIGANRLHAAQTVAGRYLLVTSAARGALSHTCIRFTSGF